MDLTPSQVKKAGRIIRKVMTEPDFQVEPMVMADAIHVIIAFRAQHAQPLVTANNSLRSMIRTEQCQVKVSQRLKRLGTIINKLGREPTLSLANMQDIGGCRAILNSIDEVRRVEERLKLRRPPVSYSDYISSPRDSGYRGVHVVVQYQERRIEVQLRTWVMHEWAITVERISARLGANLKGDGKHPVQLLLAAISEAMAIEETNGQVSDSLATHIGALRTAAGPYLRDNTR